MLKTFSNVNFYYLLDYTSVIKMLFFKLNQLYIDCLGLRNFTTYYNLIYILILV